MATVVVIDYSDEFGLVGIGFMLIIGRRQWTRFRHMLQLMTNLKPPNSPL